MTEETKLYRRLLYIALAWALFIAYGSLLPFDFHAVSFAQIRRMILDRGAAGSLISLTDRVVNVLIAVPLGFFSFGALARPRSRLRNVFTGVAIVAFSVVLAAAVEFLQLYLPTRSASYGDIIAQGVGTCLGIILWGIFGKLMIATFRTFLAGTFIEPPVNPKLFGFARFAALPYLLVLMAVNGWFAGTWLSLEQVGGKIHDLNLFPLAYHYDASIFRSLYSVVLTLIEYAPIGVFSWLGTRPSRSVVKATFSGLSAGLIIECGKLFLLYQRPDSTNVFLAAFSSGVVFALWPSVVYPRLRPSGAPIENSATDDFVAPHALAQSPLRMIGLRTISIALFALTFVFALWYPLGAIWLAAVIALYSLVLLRFPTLWLIVIPALLPSFDLAPWTGRFFFDEFDLFLLSTIAAGLWLTARRAPQAQVPRWVKCLLLALAASALISVLIGLLPLQPLDANAFANYYSRYNALRSAKGFFALLGLLPLLLYNLSAGTAVARLLSTGMVIGLATVVGGSVWERAVFPGLLNFASDYRISALFSTMHTGDAPIETYLAVALPFAMAWAHYHKTISGYAVAFISFVLGTYALFVTFSRGGYLAYLVVLAVLLTGGVLIRGTRSQASKRAFMLVLMLSIAIGSVTSLFVLEGSFPRSRLAKTDVDLVTRIEHWRHVLGMMDDNWWTATFGMGLGRYPETDLKKTWSVRMPANYTYVLEGGNQFLRLGSGAPAYLEQIVDIQPEKAYKIALDLRGEAALGTLNVMLCQRTFFRSYNCRDSGVWSTETRQNWTHRDATIESGLLGGGPWLFRRTVKFMLENTSSDTAVDIDNIQLLDAAGTNLLTNGDFSKGNDRWFFSSFDHLHWHIKNIWVQVFFEQGVIGIIVFSLFVMTILVILSKAALSGEFIYTALLASVSGFLCVGLFGSPLDAPRLAFLFYFLTVAGALIAGAPVISGGSAVTEQLGYFTHRQALATGFFQDDHNVHEQNAEPSYQAVRVVEGSIWDASRLAKLAIQALVGICTFVGSAWLVMHSPFVPYNVRDLLHPVHPLLSLIVFALFIFWSFGFTVITGYIMTQSKRAAWSYPILLACHSVVAWFLLTYSVSFDRIHKIVGSPVLHWHWYWEPAGRFAALFSALSLSMTAATLVVLALIYRRQSAVAFFSWLITAAALSPLLYWIVVTKAATDNLVELMAGGGNPAAVFLLSFFVMLVFFGGSCLAAQFQSIRSGLRYAALLGVLISIPLAYLAFSYGTESALEKYGKVFSTMQFLLSRDREHYAQGLELGLRYLVFHAGLIGGILLVQLPMFAWLFPAPGRSRTH